MIGTLSRWPPVYRDAEPRANETGRRTLIALAAAPLALLCLAAQPLPKAAPKTPAPKVAAPKRPAPAAPFDIQTPQGFIDLLSQAGATTRTADRAPGSVFITVTSKAANFSMQFEGCSPQGRACRAMLLDAPLGPTGTAGPRINAFNQTSVMCRLYQDTSGVAHVVYSALLFEGGRRDDAATHLLAWQGCLSDGRDFLRDPAGYLANAA